VAITRAMSIVYGGTTVPSTGAGYQVDLIDIHRLAMDYRSVSVSFGLALRADTAAIFVTQLAALRAAFSTPRGDLTITIGGSVQFAGAAATHTAYAAEASFEPLPAFQSARSAAFRVTIEATLPADLSGQDGRFSAAVQTTYTPEEIRQVRIAAEYSALSGTAASGKKTAFETYADAIVAALSGTFEVALPTSVSHDDFDEASQFSRTYQELHYDQSGAGTNHAALVNTRYRVTRSTQAAEVGALSGAEPPSRVRVAFETGVIATQSDTEATLIRDAIKPYLAQVASDAGASGTLREVSEEIFVDLSASRASGVVEYLVFSSTLLDLQVDTSELISNGVSLIPVLDPNNKWRKDRHYGPAFRTRTVTIYVREEGTGGDLVASSARGRVIAQAERDGFDFMGEEPRITSRDLTLSSAVKATFTESLQTLYFEFNGENVTGGGNGRTERTGDGRRITQVGIV